MANTIYETSDGKRFDSTNEAYRGQAELNAYNHQSLLNSISSSSSSSSSSYSFGLSELQKEADYYESQKQYEKAISIYNEALNKQAGVTNDTIIYARRGQAYFNLQQYDNAISDFEKALQNKTSLISTDIKVAYNRLGYSYSEKGNDEKAIESYKRAADYGCEYSLRNLAKRGIQYIPARDTSTSSTASGTAGGKGSLILSAVFAAACGFFITGIFSNTVIGIGGIIFAVAAVLGFIAWRKKNFMLKAILVDIIIVSSIVGKYKPELLPRNWGAETEAAATETNSELVE